MADDWVSPDSSSPESEDWEGVATATYDENTGTFNYVEDLAIDGWTSYMQLLLDSPIQCDKVRIYASLALYNLEEEWEYFNPYIVLEAYYNDAWQSVFTGFILDNTWVEKVLGGTYTVTKARVKFQNAEEQVMDVRFNEFDFNQVPSGLARPLVGGSLAAGKKGLAA